MNLWNVRDLPLPPINTFKVLNKDIDIKQLRKLCTQLRDFLNKNKHLHAEYLILSQIVYRMKQKFRSSKDFKSLEKLYKALQRFFSINLAADLETFLELLPITYTKETYLPTKNLLDFILVRLQGIVKLMERVGETCKISGYLFNDRLDTGQFWKIAFILFSLVSRVYILAKYVTQKICEFYTKLLPYINKLKNLGTNWLPLGYDFPKDLGKWANIEWLDIEKEVIVPEKYIETQNCMKMLKNDSFDEYLIVEVPGSEEDSDEVTEIIDIDGTSDNKDNDDLIFVTTSNNSSTENVLKISEGININSDEEKDDLIFVSTENLTQSKDEDDDVGIVISDSEIQNYTDLGRDGLITNMSNSNISLKMSKKKKRKMKHFAANDVKNVIQIVKSGDTSVKQNKKKKKLKGLATNLDFKRHQKIISYELVKEKKSVVLPSRDFSISTSNNSKEWVQSVKNDFINNKVNYNNKLKKGKRKGEVVPVRDQHLESKQIKLELPQNPQPKSTSLVKKKKKKLMRQQ